MPEFLKHLMNWIAEAPPNHMRYWEIIDGGTDCFVVKLRVVSSRSNHERSKMFLGSQGAQSVVDSLLIECMSMTQELASYEGGI